MTEGGEYFDFTQYYNLRNELFGFKINLSKDFYSPSLVLVYRQILTQLFRYFRTSVTLAN